MTVPLIPSLETRCSVPVVTNRSGPTVVPQFETCGREIHPEFIQSFLPHIDVYIFPSCGFRCLAFLELSTGSVHCAPDENDRPSEQTGLCFAFVNLCCFLNSLFGELTKIRA